MHGSTGYMVLKLEIDLTGLSSYKLYSLHTLNLLSQLIFVSENCKGLCPSLSHNNFDFDLVPIIILPKLSLIKLFIIMRF
jgi:hypothetical protein